MLADLLRRRKCVLMPVGTSPRYDFLVDDGGRFVRIQVKTGRLVAGAIVFPTSSLHVTFDGRTRARRRGYRGDCELFAVYCPDTDRCYYVPVNSVGGRSGGLRVEPARNNQAKRVRWARDFEDFPAP